MFLLCYLTCLATALSLQFFVQNSKYLFAGQATAREASTTPDKVGEVLNIYDFSAPPGIITSTPLDHEKKMEKKAQQQSARQVKRKLSTDFENMSCKICIGRGEKEMSYTQEDLYSHIKTHFQDSVCDVCSSKYQSAYNGRCHFLTSHLGIKIKCTHCEKEFSNPANLKQHEETHLPQKSNKSCASCGKSFSRANYLAKHVKTCGAVSPNTTVTQPPSSEYVSCIVCSENVKRDSVKNHMKVFHKDKFVDLYGWDEDEEDTDNEHIYECAICNTVFKEKSLLNQHLNSSHPREKRSAKPRKFP